MIVANLIEVKQVNLSRREFIEHEPAKSRDDIAAFCEKMRAEKKAFWIKFNKAA